MQALTPHCAPGRLKISGNEAYDHVVNYITLVRELHSSAITVIEKCDWVLDQHLAWLPQVITETRCIQRQDNIELATCRVMDVKKGLTVRKRKIGVSAVNFGLWATGVEVHMRKYSGSKVVIEYGFEMYLRHLDNFTEALESFRRLCSGDLRDED